MEKLPEDLLIKIIYDCDTCQSIGECRAVCKQWNRIAEPLMFSKQIAVKNERAAVSLLGHLYKNIANGKRVKHIQFADAYLPTVITDALLELTFTPNIESMTGIIGESHFFKTLVSIAGADPGRFTKLKLIPSQRHLSSSYQNALIAFKSTLQEIFLHLDDGQYDIVNHLSEFTSLRKIHLDGSFRFFTHVDEVLSGCSHLEEVTMNFCYRGRLRSKEEMEVWNSATVNVVEKTINKVYINNYCRSDVLEYLVFKYPNIKAIVINASKAILMKENNLERILDIVCRIGNFKVSFKVNSKDLAASVTCLGDADLLFATKLSGEGFQIELDKVNN